MRDFLRRLLPTRVQIENQRWLRWLAPLLGHPRLWHWSRRGVALGVAIGVFFGLLIPLGQIPLSVTAAVLLRANVPVAAASTLVSNPVTFAPIYYGAYRLGAWMTGGDTPPPAVLAAPVPASGDLTFWAQLSGLGLPLVVGLALAASLTGLASYALISLFWIINVRRRRKRPRSVGGR